MKSVKSFDTDNHIDVETGTPMEGFTMPDGNPKWKKEKEIPIFGRIVALADVYDALYSRRVYKEAWEESDVLLTIEKEAGSQLDPELVEILFSRLNVLRSIQERYADTSWWIMKMQKRYW